ncbi:ExeA family protein [Candidatus Thiosymbion oneisti]|uniref:ExeA family protein n=1 Tax=Candidatus Thiosymbion oneisti TaxID=589554 RepID=UPI000A45959B|nr:ExeA family protein [Candidatus Thiosymbion oneisti]
MQNLYSNYFGLKEASFSITPDPQYLFLSEQHREALAHLLYGAGTSGGFVLLTGEVGTGKTTICRAFLEQLPDGVEVALILNPTTTVTELLRTVCDELRIEVSEQERTVKCLVDRLNDYLLRAHAEGRRAVLMIDEAQDLRPKVLEQVRLLTNLETTKHKLLQIFLVGQPELRTLLQREGLRQLNQRITARYHLRSFNAAETAEYIRHRLMVAGVERQLFTRDAIRLVHRVSGGVPRLINILCDRSLLGACVTPSPLVTKSIVKRAAREVKHSAPRPYGFGHGRLAMATAALMLAVAGGWMTRSWLAEVPVATPQVPAFLARWLPSRQTEPRVPVSPPPKAALEQAPGLALAEPEAAGPGEDLILADIAMDRASAMRVLLRRWGVEPAGLGPGDPCVRVMDYGLRCEFDGGGWSRMRFFDRPALIELVTEDLSERYLVIGGLDAEAAVLDLDEGSRRVSLATLDDVWDGDYLLLWQPPPVGGAIIGPGSRGEPVRWLRKLLSQVPDLAVEAIGSGVFDPALDEAVRRFQKREGLKIDGIAGPKTLIRLHNVVGMPEIPKLAPVP